MPSVVQHGATTFLVDDAASIGDACSSEALGAYLSRIDRSVDAAYVSLRNASGERSVIVLVNPDGRVWCWLLQRSGDPVDSSEAVAVVGAVMQTEPVSVHKPIGFASHFAVGGAPLHVKQLDVLPDEWQELVSTAPQRPASMAEFFDLFWSTHA